MERINHLFGLIEKGVSDYSLSLNKQPKELYQPVNYFLAIGGKRLRPMLVLSGTDLYGGDPVKALPLAIGIELFHNFSLMHDDIMDNAPLRRNNETIHIKYGNNAAILGGDLTFSKAYECLLNAEIKAEVKEKILKLFTKTAIEVCEGQQMDMNFETQSNVTVAQYLKMIEYKTAVLLATSLKMGALAAGADDIESDKIYRAGIDIGIAFQLQDDILDVYGNDKFGKQKGGDIAANKKTWLLLKSIEMSKTNHYKHEELVQWQQTKEYSVEKIESVTAIYDFLNIRTLAEKEMNSYFDKGIKKLSQLKADKKKTEEFIQFVNRLISRTS